MRISKHHPRQGVDLNGGVYISPLDFLQKVNSIFPIGFDLAADASNNAPFRLDGSTGDFFSASDDALKGNWPRTYNNKSDQMWSWLNPPYGNIAPWARKCAAEAALGARVLLLVPQGTQKWAMDHCQGNALELRIDGRLTFEGQSGSYPKDLTLWVFGAGLTGTGVFRWRKA